MKTTLRLLALSVVLLVTSRAAAQNDEADKKTIKRIVEEIALVPSLYAKDEAPMRKKELPKFSALKLVSYPIGTANLADKEREKWRKDKDQYAKDQPHRAFIFASAEAVEKVSVAMTLPGPLDPKAKAAFLLGQQEIGITIFKLQTLLTEVQNADREKEKLRRWLVDSDFAQARTMGNLLFLYEYNYTLGSIRADNLPELGKDDNGWKIAYFPKITVPEPKAKDYMKARAKLLQKIQDDHPDTPWAFFAARESKRELGMKWVVKGK